MLKSQKHNTRTFIAQSPRAVTTVSDVDIELFEGPPITVKKEVRTMPPKPTTTLTPIENLSVGAVGGALETCLQMPILTYKFCVQEGRALPQSVGGWYRGVTVQAGTVAPITAIQFMANGIIQNAITTFKTKSTGAVTSPSLSGGEQIFAAATAGAISAVVYSPVDLITIQQQKLQLNPINTLKHIYQNYGLTHGLYRGFGMCVGREAIYTAGYLGLAPVITDQFVLPYLYPSSSGQQPSLLASFTGACIAGTSRHRNLHDLLGGLRQPAHVVDTTCTAVSSPGGSWSLDWGTEAAASSTSIEFAASVSSSTSAAPP